MLEEQTNFWGSADIYSDQPKVSVYNDVVFHPSHPLVPFDAYLDWGVYSSIGQRVDAAAFRRGAGRTITGQSEWKPYPVRQAAPAPHGEYIYGGVIIDHYGHFICTSLSRLWRVLETKTRHAKVVFHSPVGSVDKIPGFVMQMLQACGLRPERLYIPQQPTFFERLEVPEPALVEQAFGHALARQTFSLIGDRLDRRPRRSGTTRPVYLSKTQLASGMTRIHNEASIEAELMRFGVEVVCPELLSLRDQIALFRSGRTVIGQAGSGFHTSAFADRGGKLVTISFEQMNTNQMILDRLTFADVSYVKPLRFSNLGRVDGFATNYEILDPIGTASALAAYL